MTILLVLISTLNLFTKVVIQSVPPVDAPALTINAVPSPINIPPYMHANNLSSVSEGNPSNIFKKKDNKIVPPTAFNIKYFPIFKYANINSGIFITKLVVPTGIFYK